MDYFKKKDDFRRLFVSKIINWKSGLLKSLKSSVSAHLWTVNMLKSAKNCLNLHGSMFVIFFDHSETKGAPKSIFLLVSEIFRLFFNILTPDDKYCISVKASVYRDQFKCYYVQIKNYLLIFFCTSRISITFGILWRQDDPLRLFVAEIIDCKKRCYWKAEKIAYQGRQHVKAPGTLHKFSLQYFCHIFW